MSKLKGKLRDKIFKGGRRLRRTVAGDGASSVAFFSFSRCSRLQLLDSDPSPSLSLSFPLPLISLSLSPTVRVDSLIILSLSLLSLSSLSQALSLISLLGPL